MEANLNTPLIAVHTLGETMTVSSLDVASGLGIQHKNLLDTINTYQQAIESDFGRVAFETRPLSTRGGIQTQSVAQLTEDQALFIGTLSRNSKRVVAFKATLVKSFSEARRLIQESLQPATLSQQLIEQQAQRIARLERQMERLLETQQQAARSLLELPRSTEPLPLETTRSKIQQLVNSYCAAKKVKQQQVWRRIYNRLYFLYHISIRAHNRSERESWLDVAERKGYLDKIFAIASAELLVNPDEEQE